MTVGKLDYTLGMLCYVLAYSGHLLGQPGFNASSGAVPDPRSDFYCGANAGKPSDNTSAAGGNGNYCPVTDNGN